jgi:hypothetical protein
MNEGSGGNGSKRSRAQILVSDANNDANTNNNTNATRLTPTLASLALKVPTKTPNGELTYTKQKSQLVDEGMESPRKKERISSSPPLAQRKSVLEELPATPIPLNDKHRSFARPPMLVIENPAGKLPAAEGAKNIAAAAEKLQRYQKIDSIDEASVVTPKTTTHRSSLHAAILHGDIPAVKRLLGEGRVVFVLSPMLVSAIKS